MAIPPTSPDFFGKRIQNSINQDKSEEVFSGLSPIEKTVVRAISISRSERDKKLAGLTQDVSHNVYELQKELSPLREPSLELCRLKHKAKHLNGQLFDLRGEDETESSRLKIEELEEQEEQLESLIEEATNKMETFIEKLSRKYPSLNIKKDSFSIWWQLDRIDGYTEDAALQFAEEQLLNSYVNQLFFTNDVRDVIEEKKLGIFQNFYTADIDSLDLSQVSFILSPVGSEAHNRGKLPVQIVFYLEGTELLRIFFKPRNANVDAEIIQTFRILNGLPTEKKSLDISLPDYKIINMFHGDPNSSIWEFIEGIHLEGYSADQAIKTHFRILDLERDILYQQLLRLESVCSYLKVSDLHLENLIFSNLGQGDPKIIPIDLESIQLGSVTGLFMDSPNLPSLSADEIEILEDSKRRIDDLSVRFVPINTSHFLGGLTRCNSFVALAEGIKESIESERYELCIPQKELEWLVLNDFLHNDIPYLTKTPSGIYYVVAGEERLIGRRS